jgi:hypothetical protein
MSLIDDLGLDGNVCLAAVKSEIDSWIGWTVTGIEVLAVPYRDLAIAVAYVQVSVCQAEGRAVYRYRHNVGQAFTARAGNPHRCGVVHTVVLDPTIGVSAFSVCW